MTGPVRILLLEDDACDAELAQRELRRDGLACTVRWIADKNAFVAALDQFTPDLILADYSLPGFDGLTALSLARRRFPDIPGIIVSGAIGEETAIDVLKGGATDYVLKQRLSRLGLVVRRALQEAEQLAAKRRAEEALRAAEFRYRTVADNTYDFEFWLDPEGRCLYASPAFQRIYGRDVAEFVADPTLRTRLIHPDDREVFERHAVEEEAKHAMGEIEYRVMWPDGTYRWVNHACRPIFDEDGRYLGVRGSNRDITERKRAEEQIRQQIEELRSRNDELTRLTNAMVDRELRMIELKKQVNDLCREIGRPPCYALAFESDPDAAAGAAVSASGEDAPGGDGKRGPGE